VNGGECIPQSVQEKFLQSCEVRFFLHLRAVQKPCLLKTLDPGVNLGGAHAEIGRDHGDGRPLALISTELQCDHDVLRLQGHALILYSRFANSEYYRNLMKENALRPISHLESKSNE
jgi:hypothetical protein